MSGPSLFLRRRPSGRTPLHAGGDVGDDLAGHVHAAGLLDPLQAGRGVDLQHQRAAIGADQIDAGHAQAEHARGADLRCFVVGGRVVATMKRQAPKGDFRSNLHRGGTAKGVSASVAEEDVAIRAARVLGLGIAGVDLIRSKRGPLVLEVNASPGLEGIEEASGVDVAGEIVTYLADRVRRKGPKRAATR